MGIRVASVNFTKGEISPEVEARFDLDVYKAALRKASNVIIRRTGGVRKRPGTRFVAAALGSSDRLVAFQFSDTQAYCLDLAQAVMRPLALGGLVLETGLKVTGITNQNPAKVTCAYHGYSVGDNLWFDGEQGMTEINDRFGLTVTDVPDSNNFHVNYDATAQPAFTGDTGGQVNTAPPPPPPSPPPPPPPSPSPPSSPPVTGGGTGGGRLLDQGNP